MKKYIKLTPQQKTSAKLRVRRLIFAIKQNIDIPFNYKVVGSFKEGNKLGVDEENGKYDIDINITLKGKYLGAHETYIKYKKALSNHIRKDEGFNKKESVIRIVKEKDFYIDIAIIDEYSKPKRIIYNNKGKYEWKIKK